MSDVTARTSQMAVELEQVLADSSAARQLAQEMVEQDVGRSLWPTLDDADLRDMGVSKLGHRRALLAYFGSVAVAAPPALTKVVPPHYSSSSSSSESHSVLVDVYRDQGLELAAAPPVQIMTMNGEAMANVDPIWEETAKCEFPDWGWAVLCGISLTLLIVGGTLLAIGITGNDSSLETIAFPVIICKFVRNRPTVSFVCAPLSFGSHVDRVALHPLF